jgi:hypothetical protein
MEVLYFPMYERKRNTGNKRAITIPWDNSKMRECYGHRCAGWLPAWQCLACSLIPGLSCIEKQRRADREKLSNEQQEIFAHQVKVSEL